jgi:hypothetical protein
MRLIHERKDIWDLDAKHLSVDLSGKKPTNLDSSLKRLRELARGMADEVIFRTKKSAETTC